MPEEEEEDGAVLSDGEEERSGLEVKRETVVRGVRIKGTVLVSSPTASLSRKKSRAPEPPGGTKGRSVSFAGDTLPVMRNSISDKVVVGEPKTKRKPALRRSMSTGHYPAPQPPDRPKKT